MNSHKYTICLAVIKVPGKFWLDQRCGFCQLSLYENSKKIHSTNLSTLLKYMSSSNVEVSLIHLPVI